MHQSTFLILTLLASMGSSLTTRNADEDIANTKALDVKESERPKSRRKRSVIFPTGSDLDFTVSFSIPIEALSATSN